jgi:hypothetical protein
MMQAVGASPERGVFPALNGTAASRNTDLEIGNLARMGDVPGVTATYRRLGKPPILRIGDHDDEWDRS